MKIMAIDFGEKRVGIASTDESGRFALPRAVFPNAGDLVGRVLEFIEENEIEQVVLGESRDFSGKLNPIMDSANKFKKELERREGLKVVWHPEVLTTIEASHLQGEGEMIDASAAALILKSYIETLE